MASNYISRNLSDTELLAHSKGEVYNDMDISLRGSTAKTVSGGLYDKRIFGSERFCECGKSFSAGHVCPICAVHIESPADLRKRFAHITLKYPYLSPYHVPTFIRLFKRIFGPYMLGMAENLTVSCSLKRVLIIIHKYQFHWKEVDGDEDSIFKIGGKKFKPSIELADEDSNLDSIGLNGIKILLNAVEMNDDMKALDTIIHKVLLISPAITRMYSLTDVKGRTMATIPPMTINYKCIIYANNRIDKIIDYCNDKSEAVSKIILLQLMISFMFTSSPITASSKQSFVRGSASTTASKSGRATIISDHNLKITEVSIPWQLLYHALQSDVRMRLKDKGVENFDEAYRNHNDEADKAFKEILETTACLIVRNPTLHKYNLTAFKPIPNNDEVIHLCPLVCNSYNADFDGDQVAFFLCTDPIKSAEVMERMSAEGHWYYTKWKNASAYTPNREILQGLGIATKLPILDPQAEYPHMTLEEGLEKFNSGEIKVGDPIVINNKVTTFGRAYISKIIGADIDGVLGPNHISVDTIAQIMCLIKPNGPEKLVELEKFSIECLKHKGVTTLTLGDLYVDTNKYAKRFDDIIKNDKLSLQDKEFQLTKTLSEVLDNLMNDLPVPDIKKTIHESNRYKVEQLTSLIGPTIINNGDSFEVSMNTHLDGLGTKAYVEEAINNRTIWGYKQALVTVGGYNARQLAVLARDLEFTPSENTNETEDIWLPDGDRSIWSEKEAKANLEFLKNREVHGPAPIKGYVKVRSCIFNGENKVYSNEIDSTIYQDRNGNLHPFNIGIDMMQSFSEPVTQGALALKHGGSEYNYVEDAYRVDADCKVLGVSDNYIKIQIGDVVKTLMLPNEEFREVTTKTELKGPHLDEKGNKVPGDILFDLKKKEHITSRLAKVSAFIDSNVMMDVLRGVPFCDCYALAEGEVHFAGPNKIEIGGVVHNINPDSIVYVAEGDRVPRLKRICSGILDIKKANKTLGDLKLTFLAYRKQIRQLVPKLNLDITEIMFKSTYKFGFSLHKKLNQNTDLVGTLYKGSTKGNKSVLKNFINKDNMKLFDSNDLLYKLIFADGLHELKE